MLDKSCTCHACHAGGCMKQKFDLHYYDGVTGQEEPVMLTVNSLPVLCDHCE